MKAPWSGWSHRRRLQAAGAILLVLALTAATLVLPETGLRWGVGEAMRRLGMAEVSITGTEVALFDGRLAIRRFLARPRIGQALGLDGLDLSFRWGPLFHRKVSVRSLDLSGLSIVVQRDGGRLVVNGLPMELGGGGNGNGKPWAFDVDSLKLSASRIAVADGPLHLDIAIDLLEIQSVHSGDPSAPTRFHLAGRIDGAPVDIAGTATPFAAEPAFDVKASAERLDVAILQPLLAASGVGRLAGRLTAGLALSGVLAPAPHFEADGDLTLAEAGVTAGEAKVGAESVAWHGRLALGKRIEAAGRLAVKALKARAGATGADVDVLTIAADDLAWDGRHLEWRGGLAADNARVAGDGFSAAPQKLSWQGRTIADFGEAGAAIRLEGRLEDDGAAVTAFALEHRHRRAAASGTVELALGRGGAPRLSATLALDADALLICDPQANRDLAAADRIEVEDLRLAPGQPVTVGKVQAQAPAGLRTAGRSGYPWRLEAKAMRLERARLAEDGALAADVLAFDGLTLRLTRTKAGFVGALASGGEAKAETPPPRIALGRLTIGGRSRLEFADRTTSQPVRLDFDGVTLSLTDLDSSRPGRDSPFELNARAGVSTLSATGTVKPFAPQITGRLSGRIKAFELPPLSPYAADALGVNLQTGHFDGDIRVTVDGGALDGKVDLALSNLFIDQPDPNAPIAKHAEMPVATVLNLLRDGDDNIHLAIPIHGDLADPQFDVSDAVSQAIGGALRSTALTTLKVVFPFAALIEAVTDDQSGLALAPIGFTPGDDGIDNPGRARLAAIGEMMKSRPGIELSLCPVAATGADWPVLLERRKREELGLLYRLQKMVDIQAKPETTPPDGDALSALAERRAETVKAALVDQGIDAGRLFSCRVRIEADAKAAPRVDLKL